MKHLSLWQRLENTVRKKAEAHNQNKSGNLWREFGLMGAVGWSIVIPTLAGMALGNWIDSGSQSTRWTAILTVAGLVFGCIAVWLWAKDRLI